MTEETDKEKIYEQEMLVKGAELYAFKANFYEEELKIAQKYHSLAGAASAERKYSDCESIRKYCMQEAPESSEHTGKFDEDWLSVLFQTQQELNVMLGDRENNDSYKVIKFLNEKVKKEHNSVSDQVYYAKFKISRTIDDLGVGLDSLIRGS